VKSALRAAWLIAIVALATGCRSNFGGNARPAANVPNLPFDVQDVVATHNRDAMLVTTFEAKPAVTFRPGQGGRSRLVPGGVLRGDVYAEPGTRNFRLVLRPPMQGDCLDIGSNNDRFWLWSPQTFGSNDVYTCSYDESGAVPLSTLYQPDWLMEAMGLAPLPETTQPGIKVRSENGDAIIEQRRQGPDGAIALKETIISGVNRRIAEHRLYQLDQSGRKDLVARAVVKTYERYAINGPVGETTTLELPGSFQLIWPTEQVELTVQFQGVKLNAGFERPQQKMLFTLPEKRGSKQQDLRAAIGTSDAPSTVRETLPSPPTGVQLSEPVPAASRDDGPSRDIAARRVSRAAPRPDFASAPPAERSDGPLIGDGPPRPPGGNPPVVITPDWRASDGVRP
jgi:hypothetical protein